jgi:type II secretory pathway pseudopilin PulG
MTINFRALKSLQGIILILIIALVAITVFSAYINSIGSANDKKRVTDIAKIQEALKVDYNVNGYYPSAQDSKPKGIDTYLDFWPTAPAPNGTCTVKENTYVYSDESNWTDYSLTFCLGKKYENLNAGPHTASIKGIK